MKSSSFMKFSLSVCVGAMCLLVACQAPPKTLDEQLDRDNPKIIAYLSGLASTDIGKSGKGIRLSDGSVELKDATYLGSKHIASKKQHIFVFRTSDGEHAYVWVDKGGTPLSIPPVKEGSTSEHAYVLSGDIYTFTEVHPGDGVVIIEAGDSAWMKRQK